MTIDWDRTTLRITLTGRSGWQHGQRIGWRNSVPGHDLWYVISGTGSLFGKGGQIPLASGTCVWLSAGHVYEAEQDPEDPVRNYYVHFDLIDEHGVVRPVDRPRPPERLMPRSAIFVGALMRQVVELIPFYQTDIADRFVPANIRIANQLMQGLAMDLDESSQVVSGKNLSTAQRHHGEVVLRAIERMQDTSEGPCTVASLAKEVGYSTEHFSRVFRANVGHSPEEFLLNLRTEHAKHLLVTSSMTVQAIALTLGYGRASYFSTQFRKRAGLTPRAFRQAHTQAASES